MVINITLGFARLRFVMLDCGCAFAGVSLAAPCAKAAPASRRITTARAFARADANVLRLGGTLRCATPLPSAAKAALENESVIAALKRCATQNQVRDRNQAREGNRARD